jgi:hypothetical protein
MNMIKSRPRHVTGAVVAGVLLAAGIAASAAAASATPDLQGVWKLAAPTKTLKPVSGSVPFTAQGRKQYEENKRLQAKGDYDDYDITLSRCNNAGVPRLMMTPERFKIWQRFGIVTFDFEWNRALRQIDASGQPPREDMLGRALATTMTGTSKGHWEGDTLVAETTNLSDRTLLDDLVPHTQDIKVIEHLRLVDPDTLEDRITIDDSAYFKRPWDAVLTYKRQPAAVFPEDVCLDRVQAHQAAFPSR